MKRLLTFALALGLVAALAVPAVAAPAEKTAWSGTIIYAANEVGSPLAVTTGTGFVVANDNNWTLVATAEVDVDLDHAVVLSPDFGAYTGACFAGVGLPTQDWRSVTTPSGNTKLVCHGLMP